jgi:restriction endonuclease S subunit
MQILRSISGNAQPKLNIKDIYNLVLFIPNKKLLGKIGNTILEAKNLIYKSKSLYLQAENLLLDELGLKDFNPKYELSYTAKLSDTFGVHRVDAEYFQPAYEHIEEYLVKEFGARPIGKISFIAVTTGQYCEEYVEKAEGMPYIRGTDLKNGTVSTDDLVYINPENQIESKKTKEGDIVVTRVGTIGLSARIPKECEGGTISDNLIRLRFDQEKLNSYFLALFLGSPIGVNLMIRNSRGSVQQRLNQETLKEVVIPLLSFKTQQKLASLVQQSYKARKKSKELLEIAKRAVEIAIEKNEKEALSYIEKELEKLKLGNS